MLNIVPDSSWPTVSIILTSYNYVNYIRDAIESVFAQTYPACELIIVDDGSTDGSQEIIKHAVKDAPIKVETIFQTNRGQAAACNAGFFASSGSLVSFLDSDDYWFPQRIEFMVEWVRSCPGGGVYQHQMESAGLLKRGAMISADLFGLWKSWNNGRLNLHDDKSGCLLSPFLPTSGLLFSREILNQVMPIPEVLITCPDAYLTRTCVAYGPLYSYPRVLGGWRYHGDNSGDQDQASFEKFWLPVVLPVLNDFYEKKQLGLRLEYDPQDGSYDSASRMLGEYHRVTGFKQVESVRKAFEHMRGLDIPDDAHSSKIASLLRLIFSETLIARLQRLYRRFFPGVG